MREYINRQANRRWKDLALDAYTVSMLTVCIWGGWFNG